MAKHGKKQKITVLSILLTLTIIAIILATFFTLSKYKTTVTGIGSGRVAQYILGIEKDNTINLPMQNIKPGSSQEYYFEITNEENEKKNEVTLEYTIELENKANLPLEFTMYRYNEKTTEYEEIKLSANITEKIRMEVNEKKNHKYKIEIKWKENTEKATYDSYKYSKTLDYIKIIVNAEQVD